MRTLFRPIVASASARTFSTTARADYAKITVIGRLAGPPELHASSTGRDYIRYAVASDSGPRDREGQWEEPHLFEPHPPLVFRAAQS